MHHDCRTAYAKMKVTVMCGPGCSGQVAPLRVTVSGTYESEPLGIQEAIRGRQEFNPIFSSGSFQNKFQLSFTLLG